MSITEINLIKKIEVFFRLIQKNENILDALSKSGIVIPNRLLTLFVK
ncbi:hypothetical protein [Arcobacter sp. CECT 8989]|nr:hypothetical protein [Arcobacter sp. CECT 8989]